MQIITKVNQDYLLVSAALPFPYSCYGVVSVGNRVQTAGGSGGDVLEMSLQTFVFCS